MKACAKSGKPHSHRLEEILYSDWLAGTEAIEWTVEFDSNGCFGVTNDDEIQILVIVVVF